MRAARYGWLPRRDFRGDSDPIVVAIDQAVPRRQPAMRARADAEKIPEFVELLRNHAPTASDALIEALGGFGGFNGFGLAETEVRDRLTPAFQRGVRAAIDATARLQGLFESTEEALRETLSMLFEDMDDMRAAEEEE